mgnify:FL=1
MNPTNPLSIKNLPQNEARLRRLNRALRVLSSCNQAMLHAEDELALLAEICRILAEEGGYRMAWVGYAEHDEQKRVRPVAQHGFDEGYLESVGITWADTARGQGPVGRTIRTGAPVFAQRIRSDPAMAPWLAEALRRGYGSLISLPLKTGDEAVLGIVAVYATEEDVFSADEIQILSEAAADLSFGIASLRVRAERERLHQVLQKTEDWLRAATQGSLDALLMMRPVYDETGAVSDFELTDVNPRVEAQLNLSRNKLVGRRLSDAFQPFYEQLLPRFLPVLQSGKPLEEQFRLTTPGGRTLWVRHEVMPITDGVAVIWRDITEEVERAQKLNASEKRHRELLGSLQQGIWATDREGRTEFVNAPMAQMLGYTVGEMLGTPFFEFVDEHLVESIKSHREGRAQGIRERYQF